MNDTIILPFIMINSDADGCLCRHGLTGGAASCSEEAFKGANEGLFFQWEGVKAVPEPLCRKMREVLM